MSAATSVTWALMGVRGGFASEPLLIRRRPVERGDGDVVEPQVDGELAAVMREMIEGAVADGHVPRLLGDDVAAGEHPPGGHHVLVGGAGEGLPRLLQSRVERLQQLRLRAPGPRLILAGRGDVELVLID